LHLDPHDYYGGPDAALSLQDAETWAARHSAKIEQEAASEIFSHATIQKPAHDQDSEVRLSFSRAYSLALAPQIIHARSTLLSQLVSSRAYRQIEFLAVGSFFVLKRQADLQSKSSLLRIPSTREDVFTSTALTARSKRALMKFLKFVLHYDLEDEKQAWYPQRDEAFTTFLQQKFRLDEELQSYVLALTLSLDGEISTGDGLAIINRHLTSMGIFGAGFAAVYSKWGGLSEIAQVACRSGAVGGAVYMLDTNIKALKNLTEAEPGDPRLEIELSNGIAIRAKALVRQAANSVKSVTRVAKLIVVVGSSLPLLFEPIIEGAPTPAVAVIACPPSRLAGSTAGLESPVYATAHSADSGECPEGQSTLELFP
jgi:Rab proteins geranylgeranyltransferase component A